MRLIDADALLEQLDRYVVLAADDVRSKIERAPTVDAVEVVRCEKCKHSRKMSYGLGVTLMCDVSNRNDKYCNDRQYNSFVVDKDHFCGYGERGDGN